MGTVKGKSLSEAGKIDHMRQKVTKFIGSQAGKSTAFQKIYYIDPQKEAAAVDPDTDIFFEKRLTKSKGLVRKYKGRALFLLTYTCAANCRYCERQDRVGVGRDNEGRLTDQEIRAAVQEIAEHPDVTEVIFSGGDPLTHPKGLALASKLLAQIPHVSILRIHTRFPMQMPEHVD